MRQLLKIPDMVSITCPYTQNGSIELSCYWYSQNKLFLRFLVKEQFYFCSAFTARVSAGTWRQNVPSLLLRLYSLKYFDFLGKYIYFFIDSLKVDQPPTIHGNLSIKELSSTRYSLISSFFKFNLRASHALIMIFLLQRNSKRT